jgi:hypothetical protein
LASRSADYNYIGSFPQFVADAGDERVGQWLDERIDLARIYAEIWKDAALAHLVDVAVFCDSDDTHTASVSYFAYVRLERRCGSRNLSPARKRGTENGDEKGSADHRLVFSWDGPLYRWLRTWTVFPSHGLQGGRRIGAGRH